MIAAALLAITLLLAPAPEQQGALPPVTPQRALTHFPPPVSDIISWPVGGRFRPRYHACDTLTCEDEYEWLGNDYAGWLRIVVQPPYIIVHPHS